MIMAFSTVFSYIGYIPLHYGLWPFKQYDGMVMHVYIWQIVVVVLHSMVHGPFIIIMSPRGDILFSPMHPHVCSYVCLSQNRVCSRT